MKTVSSLVLIGLILFLLAAIAPPVKMEIESANPIILVDPPKEFIVNSTIPINIIFIGFDESLLDTNWIDSQITHWYAPTIASPPSMAGGNFTLDINYFKSKATTLETDFTNYLATIATIIDPPPDLQAYAPSATGAYLFPAVDAITWLDNNINNYFGAINHSYCFYLIDTYTQNYITNYYYYDLYMPDPDTGKESPEYLTIMYGGEYPNRGVFLDLSAGPVNYHESETSESDEGVSATTITPIWEYIFPQDKAIFNANLTEYIQETIDMVFTPSYLYEPAIKDRFDLSIYILDNTSTGDIYTNPTNYIDPTRITSALEALIFYADWTTSYYVDYLDNHPNLQQIIKDAYAATDHIAYPKAINPYQTVIDYLDTNRAEFGMTAATLPVFILAWDEYLYFMMENALGGAEADTNGNPLLVLCGFDPSLYPSQGYTKLVIHEVGHILGLRHPHDGWSWDRYNDIGNPEVSDWLRDLISTPMTYAHQDTIFSTFDYDTLDRGHTFERLNDSWYFLYDANATLLTKGYTNLDESLDKSLNASLTNISMSLQFFDQENFEAAFFFANLSYVAAKTYSNYAASLEITTIEDKETPGFTLLSLTGLIITSAIVIRRRYTK